MAGRTLEAGWRALYTSTSRASLDVYALFALIIACLLAVCFAFTFVWVGVAYVFVLIAHVFIFSARSLSSLARHVARPSHNVGRHKRAR